MESGRKICSDSSVCLNVKRRVVPLYIFLASLWSIGGGGGGPPPREKFVNFYQYLVGSA
jgi:hypothetical protein